MKTSKTSKGQSKSKSKSTSSAPSDYEKYKAASKRIDASKKAYKQDPQKWDQNKAYNLKKLQDDNAE
jgi:hypothetical protein